MKKKLTIVLLFITASASAQIQYNRMILAFNVAFPCTLGKSDQTYQNAVFPKLFPGMNASVSYRVFSIYRFGKHIGFGGMAGYLPMHGWNYKKDDNIADYDGSEIKSFFCSPLLYLRSRDYWKNRISAYAEAGPMISSVKVRLNNPVFYIQNLTEEELANINSSVATGVGFDFNTGINISLNKRIGISISISYNFSTINSILYADTNWQTFSLDAGLNLNILKNKNYYY